jgi:hypothetical protein
MYRIQKGQKSGNYEKVRPLKLKSTAILDMTKVMVHKKTLIRTDSSLYATHVTLDFYCIHSAIFNFLIPNFMSFINLFILCMVSTKYL